MGRRKKWHEKPIVVWAGKSGCWSRSAEAGRKCQRAKVIDRKGKIGRCLPFWGWEGRGGDRRDEMAK